MVGKEIILMGLKEVQKILEENSVFSISAFITEGMTDEQITCKRQENERDHSSNMIDAEQWLSAINNAIREQPNV